MAASKSRNEDESQGSGGRQQDIKEAAKQPPEAAGSPMELALEFHRVERRIGRRGYASGGRWINGPPGRGVWLLLSALIGSAPGVTAMTLSWQ